MVDWTPEREDHLRQLWVPGGPSAIQIGKIMGLTKNQVVGKSHRMKLPPRESPIIKKKHFKASDRNQVAIFVVEQPPRRRRPSKRAPSSGVSFKKCQYPFGDNPLTMTFCGKKTALRADGGRSSYCEKHHKLCHVRFKEAS